VAILLNMDAVNTEIWRRNILRDDDDDEEEEDDYDDDSVVAHFFGKETCCPVRYSLIGVCFHSVL